MKCGECSISGCVVGGFVGDRLLTRDGVVKYSQLPTLTGLHVGLAQLTMHTAVHTQTLLTSQQTLLANNLDYHCRKQSDS